MMHPPPGATSNSLFGCSNVAGSFAGASASAAVGVPFGGAFG